jgi:hypothetical protein
MREKLPVNRYLDYYRYNGFIFEYHHYHGPLKLNKDLQPSKRSGDKFYKATGEWLDLPEEEKAKTVIKEI